MASLNAHKLHGGHIGDVISFDTVLGPGEVKITVEGELRQIDHNASETTVQLSSHNRDTHDLTEFTISPGVVIKSDRGLQ